MPQAFLVRKYTIPGEEPRKEVFKPAPFYYGTLSTRDAAEQIAEESSPVLLLRTRSSTVPAATRSFLISIFGFVQQTKPSFGRSVAHPIRFVPIPESYCGSIDLSVGLPDLSVESIGPFA